MIVCPSADHCEDSMIQCCKVLVTNAHHLVVLHSSYFQYCIKHVLRNPSAIYLPIYLLCQSHIVSY